MKKRFSISFAVVVLLLGQILFSGAAFAQAPAEMPVGQHTSANWAGYVAKGETYTGVGASWVVPTPSTSDTREDGADATWIGIGGTSSRDLIQAGTQAIVQDGKIEYQSWYETLPDTQQILPLEVHGGDTVNVSLVETESGTWELNFTNITTGAQYHTNIQYDSSHSSVEWVEERPLGSIGRAVGYLPLDNFGTVHFAGGYALADGAQKTILGAGAESLRMVTNGDTVLATPGVLESDGASFSVSRTDSPAGQQPLTRVHRRHRGQHVFRVSIPKGDDHVHQVSISPSMQPITVERTENGFRVRIQWF